MSSRPRFLHSRGCRSVGALACWEVERRLRDRQLHVAAGALVLWLLLTAVGDRAGILVSGHDRGFAPAYLLAYSLGASLGLAEDRGLGLHRLLVIHFVSPAGYLVAKMAALATLLLALGVVSFVLLLPLTGGHWSLAAWEATAFTLFGLALLPLLALVETGIDTRFPGFAVLLFLLLGALVLMMTGGPLRAVIGASGLDLRPGDWATLAPLAVRTAVLVVVGPLIVLLPVRTRLPGDLDRSAAPEPEHRGGERV